MRVLVAIASYGRKNDFYLSRVVSEYQSMTFEVDIVVMSNLRKNLGCKVEVVVGLPDRNPWSLPFRHRQIFAERQNHYDLFVYSEDDTLITQHNIEAFLRASEIVSEDELVGFFQSERYPSGEKYFPSVHSHFHWIPESVKVVDGHTFARFTNEHSACYVLSRAHLKRAIASGGFLVPPHEGEEDLLVSAATDPYTQCGFRKVLCVSHFEQFLVAHLPNRYIGTEMGVDAGDLQRQIDALLQYEGRGWAASRLLQPETRLFHRKWSKNYYEPCRGDLIELLGRDRRRVLSIGCGWGATEEELVRKGVHVVGVPLDSIIGACAHWRGVEIVHGDLGSAVDQLRGEKFDGLLMSNVLHLLPNPDEALMQIAALLSEGACIVASFPNVWRLPYLLRRMRWPAHYRRLRGYEETGMHEISRRTATRWFGSAGCDIDRICEVHASRLGRASGVLGGAVAPLLSWEFVVVGRKRNEAKAVGDLQHGSAAPVEAEGSPQCSR